MRPLAASASPRQPPIATGPSPVPGSTGESSATPSCSFLRDFFGVNSSPRAHCLLKLGISERSRAMDEASIFQAALSQPSPEDRAAFLDQACGGNADLRHSVELLLRAHDKAGGFLADSPAPGGVTIDHPVTERPGTVIGSYKLVEQIGEGGMGTV